MRVTNVRVEKPLQYLPRYDRFDVQFSGVVGLDENWEPIQLRIRTFGKSNRWTVVDLFFINGKLDKQIAQEVRQHINDNVAIFLYLVELDLDAIIHRYEKQSIVFLVDSTIVESKRKRGIERYWVIEANLPNVETKIRFRVKTGNKKIEVGGTTPKINWDLLPLYPGWKDDILPYIKETLPTWSY